MKFDKETVIKHQFWFLLGGYLFVWFIAVLWLKVAAGGPIEKAKKDYESQTNALKSAQQNPVNVTKFLPPWNAAAKTFNDHKSVIWDAAWEFQKAMYDWPQAWASKDMTTPKTELSPDERFDYKDKLYPQQIEFLRKNAPTYLSPVELAGGFEPIFQPQKWQNTPTREEIWLAQEDYWVRREILLILWRAMADLAYMQPVPFDDKEEKPEGVEARYRYANQSWEMTLYLRKNKEGLLLIGGDSTLKNIDPSHRPQPLTNAKGEGIWFNVAQEQVRTRFEIRGEPVGWNETRPFSMSKDNERKDYEPLDGIFWEKMEERPLVVSQAFDVTNSPIRRLGTLALAKQDCRTYAWVLQPNQELLKLDASPDDASADPSKNVAPPSAPSGIPGMGGSLGKSGPPSGANGPSSGMMSLPGMLGGAGMAAGNRTPNNEIERDRYLQPSKPDEKVSSPSRHLPLALRLVVEQSRMHDVLLALVNSRLRIQITQVEFRHDQDYVPQSDEDKDKKPGAGPPAGGRFMGAMPGMMFGGRQMPGSGSQRMPPGGSRAGGSMTPPGLGGAGFAGARGGMGMRGISPAMMRQFLGAPSSRNAMSPVARMKGSGDTGTSQTAQDQHDDNLVDLTIYGIATLYRHPDPPASTEQTGQPGQGPPSGGRQPPPPPVAGKK